MIIHEVILRMKLLLIVANDEFIDEITSALIQGGFTATEVASTGEFVRYGENYFYCLELKKIKLNNQPSNKMVLSMVEDSKKMLLKS